MNEKLRFNYARIILLMIVAVVIISGNFQKHKFNDKKEQLAKVHCVELPKKYIKYRYSNILDGIGNNENINIKKIVKRLDSKPIVSVCLELKGEVSVLSNFIKLIEKKDEFHKISNIEIKKLQNQEIISSMTIEFSV
ncbi:hypothetical protein OW763_05200 [Clostridium aestuarii]|uniref:Uncharacterized protein n=1 Tax=Clostridium aestuarii TaxID=338193 RepID=A0ABT4D0P8_9CLOT|nr:hypothetical protein [Clostridium aestuarii]MCY6483745.1 hypothetical protein [Clostridium aestuarii]